MRIVFDVTHQEVAEALSVFEEFSSFHFVSKFYECEKNITLKQMLIMLSLITVNLKIEEN